MTAVTPQQMRELVDVCVYCAGTLDRCQSAPVKCCPDCQHFRSLAVALRAAANQLDALNEFPHDCVCQWPHGDDHPEAYGNYCSCWKSVLTPDPAPKEGDNDSRAEHCATSSGQ